MNQGKRKSKGVCPRCKGIEERKKTMKTYTKKTDYTELEKWLLDGEVIEVSEKDFCVVKEITQSWVQNQPWFEMWLKNKGKYETGFRIILTPKGSPNSAVLGGW